MVFSLPRDGIYAGNDGSAYIINAGIIALVPEAFATQPGTEKWGAFLDLKKPFTCEVTTDGEDVTSLRFGHVSIKLN